MTQDQRQRRREGSRRAQEGRSRRQEALKQRKQRTLLTRVGATLAVVAVIVTFVLLRPGGPDLGYTVAALAGNHNPPYVYDTEIEVDGTSVQVPPTSGNHSPSTSRHGHSGGALIPEQVLHNMEHGAVVIWYQPGDDALAAEVAQLARSLGNDCLVAGTYEAMDFDVAATAWGRVLPLTAFDKAQLGEFVEVYRGKEGPEAGVCRGQP
jgi:hypothetical protein